MEFSFLDHCDIDGTRAATAFLAKPSSALASSTQLGQIAKKWDSKIIVKLLDHTCDWIWRAGNRKRKSCKFAETCMEILVKSPWVNLFSVGFSHLEPLCSAAAVWWYSSSSPSMAWLYVVAYLLARSFAWLQRRRRSPPPSPRARVCVSSPA